MEKSTCELTLKASYYNYYFLYSFMKMKAYTFCARPRASIFMVFWPFSQKKNCQIVEEVGTMTKQVVKSEDLTRQTKEWMAVFFTNCGRNIIEKAVSICVIIIPQNRKVKKIQHHIIDQSFGHNSTGISYQKKSESLEEKKSVHTSRKHDVRRICQLYA